MPSTASILTEAALVLETNGLHQSPDGDPFDRFAHASGRRPQACPMSVRGAIAQAATGTPEAAILYPAPPEVEAAVRAVAAYLHLDPGRIEGWAATAGMSAAKAAEVLRRAAAAGRVPAGAAR